MARPIFSGKWVEKPVGGLLSATTFIIFLILDFLDGFLCIIYSYLDHYLEGNVSPCYCEKRESEQATSIAADFGDYDDELSLSETLYGRDNIFREMGFFLRFKRKREVHDKRGCYKNLVRNRWSDCGCKSCVYWMKEGVQKLYVVVNESSSSSDQANDGCTEKPSENVIFLHGFLSSSSLWTETVFPNLSKPMDLKYRLFAVDLFGFGRSPKPSDSMYTLKDHLGMIENSVITQFHLNSFHLVAHSMGCIIALALAAKYSKSVKTITLLAPPYFSFKEGENSKMVLNKLAGKRLWPPLLFGSSLMSWYEHLGRCVCFLICRNHNIWEWILKATTRTREVDFRIKDMTKHTHHSAWHTMHNVICGGAKLMDGYLQVLSKDGVRINILQGDKDVIVPMECSKKMKIKAPKAKLNIIKNADHSTIIFGREKELAQYLESVWTYSV